MTLADYKDENYINGLVDRYKQSSLEKDKSELIASFELYFKKYAYLLCERGPIDIHNQDTSKFLRLFMTAEERSSAESMCKASAKYIACLRKIFSDFTAEDLYDEVLASFLSALAAYQPMIADHKKSRERISFTHFIQVRIRFAIATLAKKKSKDMLSAENLVEYCDSLEHEIKNSSYPYGRIAERIDLKWVHGDTTGDLFKCLSEIERYLIWLKYESSHDEKILSNNRISRITGLHKKTVDWKLKRIRKKLKAFI